MTTIQLTIGGKSKRSRLGQHSVAIEWDKLPDASQLFVINYGLRQYLADATAGAGTEADAKAGIESRVRKLQDADFSRTRGEAADKPDTVEGRFLKLARADIRERLKAANQTVEKEKIADAAKALLAKKDEHPLAKKLFAEAKRQIDAEAKAKDTLAAEDGADILADLLAN